MRSHPCHHHRGDERARPTSRDRLGQRRLERTLRTGHAGHPRHRARTDALHQAGPHGRARVGRYQRRPESRRFARRGLRAYDAEWKPICATHNLLKLWRHPGPELRGPRTDQGTASPLVNISRVNSRGSFCDTLFRVEYNEYRPRRSLRMLTASEFAARCKEENEPRLS